MSDDRTVGGLVLKVASIACFMLSMFPLSFGPLFFQCGIAAGLVPELHGDEDKIPILIVFMANAIAAILWTPTVMRHFDEVERWLPFLSDLEGLLRSIRRRPVLSCTLFLRALLFVPVVVPMVVAILAELVLPALYIQSEITSVGFVLLLFHNAVLMGCAVCFVELCLHEGRWWAVCASKVPYFGLNFQDEKEDKDASP